LWALWAAGLSSFRASSRPGEILCGTGFQPPTAAEEGFGKGVVTANGVIRNTAQLWDKKTVKTVKRGRNTNSAGVRGIPWKCSA